MSSYGESQILVNGRLVGQLQVLNVHAVNALYPRIGVTLGIALQDDPGGQFAPGRPLEQFQLRALGGELRLGEHSLTVGGIYWVGQHRHVRSAPYPSESQVQMACDLDEAIVERIEEHRSGGPSLFWATFWPSLVDTAGFLDADVAPFRIEVPRDRWLEVLAQLTHRQIAVLEVPYLPEGQERFKAAIGHVGDATPLDEVRKHGHVLTPGRYVGALPQEDDGEPFAEKMKRLAAQLREQQAEAAKLDVAIAANMKELGYGG